MIVSFDCAWGMTELVFNENGILRLSLPMGEKEMKAFDETALLNEPGGANAIAAIRKIRLYFEAQALDFSDIKIDMTPYSAFAIEALMSVRRIAYASVRTYKDVARDIGNVRAARGVGSVLAKNRTPLIIPCHRVVAANGALTGFSATGGVFTKKKMLQMEGMVFDQDDHVKHETICERVT